MRILQTLIAFSGNAPPQLAIARKLVESGHEVRVLGHRAARQRIEATGAQFLAFERTVPEMDLTSAETDTLRDWEARTLIGAGRRLLKNGLLPFVLGPARECAAALEQWPADFVLYDWMLHGAGVAAEGAGVPSAALVHCPYPLPVDGVPPVLSGVGMQRRDGPIGVVRDRAMNRAATLGLRIGVPLLNKARAEQGLAPVKDWADQLLACEAVFVLTAPELDFTSEGRLPANVHYVGPAFEPYPRQWTSPWPEAKRDPLVVISFSTSYMNQGALAQRVLDAAGGLPVRALLTAGPALDVGALRLPANARAVDYVPHRSVFPHASLVISHAGWQTINAALADGVPLLCVPDGRDQPDNAVRVVACGAGMKIRKDTSPNALGKAIQQALADDSLKRGAQQMARALARSDGAAVVVERIEEMVKARPHAAWPQDAHARPGQSAHAPTGT